MIMKITSSILYSVQTANDTGHISIDESLLESPKPWITIF